MSGLRFRQGLDGKAAPMIGVRTMLRFIVAGGGNTLLTAAVTSALSLLVPVPLAYTLGYAAGLALSAVTASRFVFHRQLTAKRAAGVCAVNLLAFVCGLVSLTVARRLGLPSGMSGLTVLVTAPVSFLGAAAVFRDRASAQQYPNKAVSVQ